MAEEHVHVLKPEDNDSPKTKDLTESNPFVVLVSPVLQDSSEQIHALPKNSQVKTKDPELEEKDRTVFMVSYSEYSDEPRVDIRLLMRAKKNKLIPTRKGLNIHPLDVTSFIEAFNLVETFTTERPEEAGTKKRKFI